MVYESSREHTFTGARLPIWRWMFVEGGRRVAFQQETVHAGLGSHYELREVSSGRLLAEYNPGSERAGDPPQWVRDLDASR